MHQKVVERLLGWGTRREFAEKTAELGVVSEAVRTGMEIGGHTKHAVA
jgi:hypothetical protein